MTFMTSNELRIAKAAHKENLLRLYQHQSSWRGKDAELGAATIANLERQVEQIDAELLMAGAA